MHILGASKRILESVKIVTLTHKVTKSDIKSDRECTASDCQFHKCERASLYNLYIRQKDKPEGRAKDTELRQFL